MITFMFCRLNNTTFLFSLGKWNDKSVSRQRILLKWNCILISQILNDREHSRECLSRGILVEIGLVSYIFSNCCKGQKSGMQIFVSPSFQITSLYTACKYSLMYGWSLCDIQMIFVVNEFFYPISVCNVVHSVMQRHHATTVTLDTHTNLCSQGQV